MKLDSIPKIKMNEAGYLYICNLQSNERISKKNHSNQTVTSAQRARETWAAANII